MVPFQWNRRIYWHNALKMLGSCCMINADICPCLKKQTNIWLHSIPSSMENKFHESISGHHSYLCHCHCLPAPHGFFCTAWLDRKQNESQVDSYRYRSDLCVVLAHVSKYSKRTLFRGTGAIVDHHPIYFGWHGPPKR